MSSFLERTGVILGIESDGVSSWRMKSAEGGVNLIKRAMEVNRPAEEVYDFMRDQEKLLELNDRMKANDVIEEFNPTTKLIRREMAGNLLVSNRDMCILNCDLTLTDGSMANIHFSIEHDKIPTTKCVRAALHIGFHTVKAIDESK